MADTLGETLLQQAQQYPDKVFLFFGDHALTFREYAEACGRLAAGLQQRGIGRGDHVAAALPNRAELAIVYGAAGLLGAVVTPFNPTFTPREMTTVVGDAEAKVLFAIPQVAQMALQAKDRLPFLQQIIAVGDVPSGALGWETLLSAEPLQRCLAKPDDPLMILYTSGTTGRPKGTILSNFSMLRTAQALVEVMQTGHLDRSVNLLPFYHVFAITVDFLHMLLAGGSVVLREQFHPREVLRDMDRYAATFVCGVPSMYILLNEQLNNMHVGKLNLRMGVVGGAPVPVEVMQAFEAKTGCVLIEGYGQTEMAPIGSLQPPDPKRRKLGTAGQPLPGSTLKILDPTTGEELPPNTPGEICVRGFNRMQGYWKMPEATAEALKDGWLHSGDIGVMDEDGYVTIVDRLKDMIIYSGYNIYPKEIENILYGDPAVAECVVAGIPDPVKGEVPYAFVRLAPGQQTDKQRLLARCRQYLAPYKIPREIVFVQDFPRTSTGKIVRDQLRVQYAQQKVHADAGQG